MKKLICFQIIVFIVCLSQVSFGAGYRNVYSTANDFTLNGSGICGNYKSIYIQSPLIRITSKSTATLYMDFPLLPGYFMPAPIDGRIVGNEIIFNPLLFYLGFSCANDNLYKGNVKIDFKFIITGGGFGTSSITGRLTGEASGAFAGSGFKSGIELTYFNGNNGEVSAKPHALVYLKEGDAASPSAVCTNTLIKVKIIGDNYQKVSLLLDGKNIGDIQPKNDFSLESDFTPFTVNNVPNKSQHTIELMVNGDPLKIVAAFKAYTQITNLDVITPSAPISCFGQAVTLNVVVGFPEGIQYGWNEGPGKANQTTVSITDFSKEYSIEMSRDEGTCKVNSNKVKIDVIPDFTASISPNKTQACEGQTIQINASPNDGNQSYFWFKDGTQLGINSNNIAVSNIGSYSVTIFNKRCPNDPKLSNTVNNLVFEKGITGDKISVTNKTSPIFCKDEANITLVASADGGVAGLGIQWGGTKSGTGDKLQVESGGQYTLQLSKGDCKTTPKTITVVGKISPTFTLNPSDAQICKGQKMSLSTTNDANYTYQWFGGADGKTDLKVNVANYDATDGGLYRVVLSPNGGNCNATTGVYEISQQVKADAPITNFQITGRKANDIVPICNEAVGVNLVATSDNDVSISWWNGGAKISSSNTLQNIKVAGEYKAEFKRGKCETSIAVTTKIQNLSASLKASNDATRNYITCSDNTDFKLVAESNFATATFKWKDANDPNFSNTNKEFAPTKAGKYYAVANSVECGATDSEPTKQVEVTLPPDFKVNIASQFVSPICEGLEQTLTATPTYTAFAGTYTWVPANTSNIVKTKTAGTYALTIQQDGCKASATTSFTTKASKPTITVVDNFNLFASPNTDNIEWLFKTLPSSSDPKSYNSLSPKETKDKLFTQTVGSYILKGNRNGCAETHSDPIEITIVTLANENTNSNTWKVYPNPSNNVVTIENNSLDFLQSNIIELRNSAGILVRYLFQSEKSKEYNVDDLSAGIYHLIFKQKNSTIVKKIVKL